MTRKGSSEEEEEFRRALNKANVGGAVRTWIPMLGAGVVGLGGLVVVPALWPLQAIPVAVFIGVPLALAAGAFWVLQKITGG